MAKKLLWSAVSAPVLACALLVCAVPAQAAILYSVTVDTSLLPNGTTGNLNFQFNPGGASQEASASLTSFSTDGTLIGLPALLGNVSGALPATVTFDNGSALNDYFQGFTFGSSFSFLLTFYGPAIDAPNGTATSGTTFGVALYDDLGTTPLLTLDPFGFAALAEINLNGSVSLTMYAPDGSNNPVVSFAEVPEPATGVVTGISIQAGWCFRRRLGLSA